MIEIPEQVDTEQHLPHSPALLLFDDVNLAFFGVSVDPDDDVPLGVVAERNPSDDAQLEALATCPRSIGPRSMRRRSIGRRGARRRRC